MTDETKLLIRCERVMKSCQTEDQRKVGRRYCDLAYRKFTRGKDLLWDNRVMKFFFYLQDIKKIGEAK